MISSMYHKHLVVSLKVSETERTVSILVYWQFKKIFDDKLPDRCDFFSSLKGECIRVKYSLHATDVGIMFKK